MKKILNVVLVLVVSLCFVTNVSAATEDDLLDYAKQTFTIAGEEITVSSENLVKIERYLNTYDIDSDSADAIIAKADEIVAILEAAGQSNAQNLSTSDQKKVLTLAQEMVELAGATLTYDASTKTALITRDGTTLFEVSIDNTVLVQTDNDYTLYVATTAVLALALGAVTLYRKVKDED